MRLFLLPLPASHITLPVCLCAQISTVGSLMIGLAVCPLVVPVHHNYIHSGCLCGSNYN